MSSHVTVYIGGEDVGACAVFVAPSAPGVQYGFQVQLIDLSPELLSSLLMQKEETFTGIVEAADGRQFILTNATVDGEPSLSRATLKVESGGWGIGISIKI
jgi:hypothetical protein